MFSTRAYRHELPRRILHLAMRLYKVGYVGLNGCRLLDNGAICSTDMGIASAISTFSPAATCGVHITNGGKTHSLSDQRPHLCQPVTRQYNCCAIVQRFRNLWSARRCGRWRFSHAFQDVTPCGVLDWKCVAVWRRLAGQAATCVVQWYVYLGMDFSGLHMIWYTLHHHAILQFECPCLCDPAYTTCVVAPAELTRDVSLATGSRQTSDQALCSTLLVSYITCLCLAAWTPSSDTLCFVRER